MIWRTVILLTLLSAVSLCVCSNRKTRNYFPFDRIVVPNRRGANGEHISRDFYTAAENAAHAKDGLQSILHNFLESLQRNLTTSTVLKAVVNIVDGERTQRQLQKLNDLATFFQITSEQAAEFAFKVEHFFHTTKNESSSLLSKLRHIPSAQRVLPTEAKVLLTNYFAEMEFFHIMFSEIIDEALEFVVDSLRAIQRTFIQYADIQRDVLHYWNFKPDEWCCNRYMEFLQQWSAEIYRCSSDSRLATVYDVYTMTEITSKYIVRQLEFRIQRLFNCFIYNVYRIRCRFLQQAEKDFKNLFDKVEDLQMYFDIKTHRGRVTIYRHRRRRRREFPLNNNLEGEGDESDTSAYQVSQKCIPYGFPETQMLSSLKACFYFPNFE